MSPDERFDVSDVERFAGAAPHLVFLGACSSGVGFKRPGDAGASTLSGALLRNGAAAVVQSCAAVALEPTVRLCEAFCLEAAAGTVAAEALRRARVSVVASGFDDPFDFALFEVVGDGDARLEP
jgi:CHAT domain-containing protein